MGRRWFVTRLSPTCTMIRLRAVLVCSMDIHSPRSALLKAQVSTTCCPWVLMILMCWPRLRDTALPRRAGIVMRDADAMHGPPCVYSPLKHTQNVESPAKLGTAYNNWPRQY